MEKKLREQGFWKSGTYNGMQYRRKKDGTMAKSEIKSKELIEDSNDWEPIQEKEPLPNQKDKGVRVFSFRNNSTFGPCIIDDSSNRIIL